MYSAAVNHGWGMDEMLKKAYGARDPKEAAKDHINQMLHLLREPPGGYKTTHGVQNIRPLPLPPKKIPRQERPLPPIPKDGSGSIISGATFKLQGGSNIFDKIPRINEIDLGKIHKPPLPPALQKLHNKGGGAKYRALQAKLQEYLKTHPQHSNAISIAQPRVPVGGGKLIKGSAAAKQRMAQLRSLRKRGPRTKKGGSFLTSLIEPYTNFVGNWIKDRKQYRDEQLRQIAELKKKKGGKFDPKRDIVDFLAGPIGWTMMGLRKKREKEIEALQS